MKALIVFYLLVLVRLLAFVSSFPMLTQKQIPNIWKVGLGISLTVIVAPMLSVTSISLHPVWLVFAILWEIVVGATFGLIVTVSAGASIAAGSLLDTQMGFANSGLLNPAGDKPEPMTASFYQTLFALAALSGSLHLLIVRMLVESFTWFPCALLFHRFDSLLQLGFALIHSFFLSVVWLALPVALALLATEVCLAFISRLVPQMNMLIAAAPIRVLGGYTMITMALPVTLSTMSDLLQVSARMAGSLHV